MEKILNTGTKKTRAEVVSDMYLNFLKSTIYAECNTDTVVQKKQKATSANTSVNKNRLPSVYTKIDFSSFDVIFDCGCGKWSSHIMTYLYGEQNFQGVYLPYDPYNLSKAQNAISLDKLNDFLCKPDVRMCMVCANVLNVLDSDDEVDSIVRLGTGFDTCIYSVYVGDKTGIGCYTKPDCYQRNMIPYFYDKFFEPYYTEVMHKGNFIITHIKNVKA